MRTKDAVLLYTYTGDRLFGTYSTNEELKEWISVMKVWNFSFALPINFPYSLDNLNVLPGVVGGFNVLGAILMSLKIFN
jgi:hypothetical protein